MLVLAQFMRRIRGAGKTNQPEATEKQGTKVQLE